MKNCLPILMAIVTFVALTTHAQRHHQPSRGSNTVMAAEMTTSNSHIDADLSRRIRQDLMKDDFLSTFAKKIKISAKEGEVVLQGRVNTEYERERIVSIAKKYVSENKIKNQLEVKIY